MRNLVTISILLLFSLGALAQSSIKFEVQKHDFGSIKEDGGKVTYVFGFKNVGDKDLIVKNVKTPCGCTSPKWTTSAIPPGKGGYVEATFDPMHRPGVFNKVLTVVTDGVPLTTYLTIVGEVLPRKRTIKDNFPMVRGNIRYQMPQVFMGKVRIGTVDTVHVRMYNEGFSPIKLLRIETPEHIKADIVTPEILPKSYGKFIVTYDPLMRAELGMVTDQIVLYSNDEKNPEQLIYVVAEIEQNIVPLTPKQLEEAPKIVAVEEMIDLGEVAEGELINGVFKIANEGLNTLRVLRVKPECGCNTTTLSNDKLEKGQTAKLNLQFDATGYDGLVIKNIDIYSNDPMTPKYTLRMKAFVKPK